MRSLKIIIYSISLHLTWLLISFSVEAQPALAWQYLFNGEGDYTDRFTCITSDDAGNIYTGGSTVNIDADRDYLIQKSDIVGNVIWRTTFNASGNGPDEILAISVDASQNVYVTGFGKSADVGNDFLTMKLSANGGIEWIQLYNYDVANGYDQANSIALDGNGNVIVTGQSDEDATAFTNDDYVTISYSNDGNQQWLARYNGVGNGVDRPVKVVVDNSNNIYITGRSDNGNDDDYVTIKYDANGIQQWLKYGDRTHHDRAQAMAIDGSNNIYVTGWSSNGTNHDFYTIKYNSSGDEQWANVFDNVDDDEANSIFADNSSAVYVTGSSDGDPTAFINLNYRTIKYDVDGMQQWTASYDGSAGNDDIPTAISVSGGSVIVTGISDVDITPVTSYDIATIEYSSTGSQVWVSLYNGNGSYADVANAAVTDEDGNTFVAGYSEDSKAQANSLLIKYDSSGSQFYVNTFDGIGDNSDNVHDVKVDAQGNLYMAGYTVQPQENRDFFTIKLNAQGDTVWTRFINGTTPGSEDEAEVCAIDNDGNLIVSGFTKNSGTSGDYTTVKIDAATGDSLWLRFYDSPIHEYDKAYNMQTDANGNVYLTGRTDSDPSLNSNDEATTLKYNGEGNLLWERTYAGAGNGPDRGSFLRIASTGNVYVAGRTFSGSDDDVLVIKYNNSGVQQWVQTYDGGAGNEDPKGMEIDVNENIYLVGNSAYSVDDSSDIITLKYSTAGDLQWANRINNGGGDQANGITLDSTGNVIITGTTDADNSSAVNLDAVTVKYDDGGNEVWNETFAGANNFDDIADAIVSDQFGNSYVALHINNGTANDLNYDIEVIRYNANGSVAWQTLWGGGSDTLDAANLLYLVNNDLYVAGSSWQTGSQRDILVLKYSLVTSVENIIGTQKKVSVFPNPSSEFITVTSDNSNSEKRIQLVDLAGRTIFTKSFYGEQIKVSLANQIAGGMYLCNILSNNTIIHSEKVIYQPQTYQP
ncbi:MAG: T9SS type A sorting domain-containing protein [Chitinophagales bacterium]|nr:T9SS type A sorting domain-containing protein [Chitinophagales bacterium]